MLSELIQNNAAESELLLTLPSKGLYLLGKIEGLLVVKISQYFQWFLHQ